jgi:hypothetical protein
MSSSANVLELSVSRMRDDKPPLNPPQSRSVLMVILWRQCVSLRNSYFMTTCVAAIDSGPWCGCTRLVQLIEGGVITLIEKIRVLVQSHCGELHFWGRRALYHSARRECSDVLGLFQKPEFAYKAEFWEVEWDTPPTPSLARALRILPGTCPTGTPLRSRSCSRGLSGSDIVGENSLDRSPLRRSEYGSCRAIQA